MIVSKIFYASDDDPEGNDALKEEISSAVKAMEEIEEHMVARDNPHSVNKAQIGLSKVDNTSDNDKPVSLATKKAIEEAVERVGQKAGSVFPKPVSNTIHVVSSGENGDGSALSPLVANTPWTTQVALDKCPDGGTIVFGEGVYPSSGLRINNKSIRIIGAGKDVTTFRMTNKKPNGSYRTIAVNYGGPDATNSPENIYMSDFTVDGNWQNQTDNTNKAINAIVSFAAKTTLERISVINCGNVRQNEAFYISLFSQDEGHEHWGTIRDCEVSSCYGQFATHIFLGAQMGGDAWGLISNCRVVTGETDTGTGGVGIGVAKSSKGVIIENCDVTSTRGSVCILHDTFLHKHGKIINNRIQAGGNGVGIVVGSVHGSHNWMISGNTILLPETASYAGIKLNLNAHNTIVSNNIFTTPDQKGNERTAINVRGDGGSLHAFNNYYDSAHYKDFVGGVNKANVLKSEFNNFDTNGVQENPFFTKKVEMPANYRAPGVAGEYAISDRWLAFYHAEENSWRRLYLRKF